MMVKCTGDRGIREKCQKSQAKEYEGPKEQYTAHATFLLLIGEIGFDPEIRVTSKLPVPC